MEIPPVSSVCFSPTGTTRTIAENISQGLNVGQHEMIDITQPSARAKCRKKFDNEIVIIAVPVYYGRVPETVVSCLSQFRAEKTLAILVTVYGNRDYDDALRELHDIVAEGGFIPAAGGAFVAEHSYSTAEHPIARGRPDKCDIQKAQEFGSSVRKKLNAVFSMDHLPTLTLPGQTPYIEPVNLNMIEQARSHVALTPETEVSICTQCGQCAEACPTDAISPDDLTLTDRWKCIICFACNKICPTGARQMNEPGLQAAILDLYKRCQERKEPECYL